MKEENSFRQSRKMTRDRKHHREHRVKAKEKKSNQTHQVTEKYGSKKPYKVCTQIIGKLEKSKKKKCTNTETYMSELGKNCISLL